MIPFRPSLRILYVSLENLSLHKGSVVHIKETVRGLRKLGYYVGLISSSWNQTEEADRFYNLRYTSFIPFRLFKMNGQSYVVSSFFLILYLFKVLAQYDVIYARDYHATILSIIPRYLFHKKVVFEINGLANEEQMLKKNSWLNRVLSFFIRKAERIATDYSDRIVSVTPQIAQYLVQYFHCKKDKVKIISNGVDTEKFYPIEDRKLCAPVKWKLDILDEDKIVAFVGNLAPWQGVEFLIRVAPMILEEVPHLKFLIIGDGILRHDLLTEVERLGLSSNIIFAGMVDYHQIPYYINIADICVLPKRRLISGYSPIKLFEYMACGKPVVATRVNGLEFIETEGSGVLTDPDNFNAFGEALLDLLKDDKRRATMGQKGLQIVLERFSWKLKVAMIGELFEELA